MESHSAIGIDIGTQNSVVATVKQGGIEILLNESSNRLTPTVIAYGEHERLIGDSAVAQQRSNFKNTIPFINRFMGITSECKEQFEEEEKYISNNVSFGPDKKISFSVTNRGESLELVPEQIYAAYLKKLKKMFANEDDNVDVVLSVPAYYSAIERQAVLDACKVAKVNCLKLINENTAIALCYGFFRRKEFTDKAWNVAFVDVGHGKTTCTVASFTDKKVSILSHASDRNVGGRNFDYLLCDLIGEEFKKKFGCDPRKAPKARLRMLDQIEKTRKILSANSEAALNIECLLEDEDLHKVLTRDELQEIMQPGIDKVREICERAFKDCGLNESAIDSVELVGEATRIPGIKRVAEEVFKKEKHHRTLNSSECVARGCSLMAAMILPHFHVAPFEIHECNNFPIDISWSVSNNNMKTKTLFPAQSNYPSVKSLTFDGRSEPMDVGVSYHAMDGIMTGLPQLLARYRVEPPQPKEEKFSLKLRVQLDGNGIPALDSAEQIEEYKEIKKIPIKKHVQSAPKPAEAKEGEGEGDKQAEAPKEPEYEYEEKEIQKTRSTQIHFKWEQHGYGAQTISQFIKAEDELCKQDNLILDVKIMRNHLETYVYDMRASLDTIGNFIPFIKDSERQAYLDELNKTEEWIYDEGESAAKDVYQAKLEELQKVGEPVKIRYRFHDLFPARAKDFEDTVNNIYQQAVDIPDDSHITKDEKEALIKACEDATNWFINAKQIQGSLPHHENPAIDFVELEQKKQEVVAIGTKTLSKPAPKKEEKPKEEPKPEDAKNEEASPAPEGDKDADMAQ